MASITGKITGGTTGAPFQSAADEIAKVGGVEEEFRFEGTATQYRLAGRSGTDYPTDGRWEVEPMSQARFRSRLHVLRPGDPDAFNGTVVVVWNNVSVGQDNFTVGAKAARMIEDGFALVGVTTQKVGVDGLPPVDEASEYYGRVMERPPGLKSYDPERYGTLEHPGDGYSYDIYTQAAQLLGPDRPREIDPLDGLRVEHLVSMGGSQSACRQATYFNAIQPITSAFDAYLMLVYAGTPTALDPSTAAERGSPRSARTRSICSRGAPSCCATTWRSRPSSSTPSSRPSSATPTLSPTPSSSGGGSSPAPATSGSPRPRTWR